MPINEYEDMLAAGAQPTAVANEYDEMLIGDKQAQKAALQQSMFAADKTEPEREATVQKLAAQTNIPAEVVGRNLDEVQKQAAAPNTDYDDLIRNSPKTSKWLETSSNAALVKDDIPATAGMEKSVQEYSMLTAMYNGLSSTLSTIWSGVAKSPAFLFDVAAENVNQSWKMIGIDPGLKAPDWLRDNPIAKHYDALATAFRPPEMDQSITTELGKGNYRNAARTMAVQFVANAPQQAALIVATLTGFGAAGLAAAGTLTGAEAYDENLDNGVDPNVALANAATKGAIEAGFERIGTFGILKHWEGKIAKEFGKQASGEIFKDFAKTLLYSTAGEANEELLTSLAQDFTDYVTGVNPDAMKGAMTRALDAGILGGVSGAGMTAPSAIGAGVMRGQQARKAALAKDFYLALGTSAESMKLRERLPEAQRALVEQVTAGTGVEHIYVPVDAVETLFQGANQSPAAVMNKLGLSQAYDQAKETGTDIQIPLGTWVQNVVGTEFYQQMANDVKFHPNDLTVNEQKAETARATEDLDKQAKAAEQQAVGLDESAKLVGKTIAEQLQEAGQSPEAAVLAERGFRSLGERTGRDPLELFNSFRARVVGEQQQQENADTQTLYQDAIPNTEEEIVALRARVAQLETELRTSDLTGLRNKKAFDEDSDINWPAVSAIDMDGLKRLNDSIGHEAADKVLRALGAAFLNAQGESDNVRFYHRSGDEFAARFKDAAGAEALMADIQNRLDSLNVDITVNGKTYTYEGIGISFGIGTNYEEADANANQQKQQRLAAGKREDARAPGTPRRLRETPGDQTGGQGDGSSLQPAQELKATKEFIPAGTVLLHGTSAPEFTQFKTDGVVFLTDSVLEASAYARGETVGSNTGHDSSGRKRVISVQVNADSKVKDIDSEIEAAIDDGNFDVDALVSEEAAKARVEGFDFLHFTHPNLMDESRMDYDVWVSLNPANLALVGDREFKQGGDDPRGRITFGPNGINIELLKNADPSTFIHELGHFYLEVLNTLGSKDDAPEQVKNDIQTIREWVGSTAGEKFSVSQHEQFARGFEAYLMEGNAPSSALQEAFARFRVWMISVYRTIRNLNVELTPEVRGVMDRLLATDEEIESQKGEIQPMFAGDSEKFGLTGKKAERYQAAIEAARQAAKDQLAEKAMREYARQKKAWYRAKAEGISKEFRAELVQQPVYIALAAIQKGLRTDGTAYPEPPPKLSKAAIVAEYGGKDRAGKLPSGVTSSEGVHPDIAADLYGFPSGEALLAALENSVPLDTAVKRLTAAKMNELYPEVATSTALPEEAIHALHNEKRAQLLRLELEYLAAQDMPVLKDVVRKVARRVPSEKIVRAQAAKIIGSRRVGDLKPYLYQRAEKKSANVAAQALAAGDIQAAFDFKRQELLNHELYRAAVAAQEDVDKSLEKFKKLARKDEDIAKTRDTDFVNAARAILAMFKVGRFENASAAQYIEPIRRYDPEMGATVQALVDSATEKVGDYETISYDEFVAMRDAVMALWDLSKSSKQMEIDGRMVSREEVMGELSARISDLDGGGRGGKDGYTRAATKWEKYKRGLMGVRASLRRVESWSDAMDGGDLHGPFRKYIWNPVSEAAARYRASKPKVMDKYLALLRAVEPSITYQKIVSQELQHEFKDKVELLGTLLHAGNESNLSKLLRGNGWGTVDENGNLDRSRWDGFVARMIQEGVLTKADFDFVQGVWDLREELKPEAQKVHKKLYGHYFNEITANEIQTPWGTYRGGYVPAIVDSFRGTDAAVRNEKDALENFNNSFMFPTAGRGFTKSRVESYAGPLLVDLSMVGSHIDKVLRFIHIEPAVKDVGRIVMDKRFRKVLDAFDPTVGSDMLVPWLQRAARQQVTTPSNGSGGKWLDSTAKAVRTRVGLQAMAGNVVNTLQQLTGFSISAVKVSRKNLRSAFFSYIRNPGEISKDIAEKSEFMSTRIQSFAVEIQGEIEEITMNPSKTDQAMDFVKKHAHVLQAITQNFVDVITWHGAYNEAIEKGESERDAVRSADSTVRSTQGSGAPEDISRFEAGSPAMRLFKMFYGYFNNQANFLGTEFLNTYRNFGVRKGAGRMLYIYAMAFMIPAVLSELLVAGGSGSFDEDDDEDYLDDFLRYFFNGQFRAATALFPVVGPTVQAGVNAFNDKWYDDRISTSPAVAMIESSVKAPYDVYKLISDGSRKKEAIKDSLTLLGLMSGLPLAPIGRPLGYLADVSEGKVAPSGPVDFTRGLVTGRGKRQ